MPSFGLCNLVRDGTRSDRGRGAAVEAEARTSSQRSGVDRSNSGAFKRRSDIVEAVEKRGERGAETSEARELSLGELECEAEGVLKSLFGSVGAVREGRGGDGVVGVHFALVATDANDLGVLLGEVANVGDEVGDGVSVELLSCESVEFGLRKTATLSKLTVLRLYQLSGILSWP